MDMTLEDMSQEKSHIQQEHAYFIVLFSEYVKPHKFQKSWHPKDPDEREV